MQIVKRLAMTWTLGVLAAMSGCRSGGDDPPAPPPPAPVVTIAANPATVQLGSASTITWSATNATSCNATGSWAGTKAASGSESATPQAAGNASYSLTCTGTGGTASSAATVAVNAPPPAPTATVTPGASTVIIGSSTTLTWSSTEATSCTASGAWSGAKSASGAETVTPAALGASSYTLTCTGAGGSIAASATVNAVSSVDFLLTANDFTGDVSAYKLDASTGAPAEVAGSPFPATASGSLRWVVFSSDNRFAYAASGDSIFSYSVDQVTGALAALPGSPLLSEFNQGMAIHPSGNWIYVALGDNGLVTYAVNPTTGALTNVGTNAFKSFSITIHPSGNLAYVNGHPSSSPGFFAFSIDSNGALNAIPGGPVANVAGSRRMAIDPTGKFAYVPNQNSTGSGFAGVFAFSINTTTGALTPVASYATSVGPSSIAFDPQGAFVYVACWGGPSSNGGLHSFAINGSTGALTQVAGSPFHIAHSWAIAVNRAGTVLYEIQASQLRSYAVGATGVLTEIPSMRLPRSGYGVGIALSH
jgi:6-phosphogluconolactonase (cycloisomerase 2 family)